jgi:hypothetical protein
VAGRSYGDRVFINCPFDGEYQPLFEALVFAVHDCGFIARCALEAEDGSQVRIEKIEQIIAACRFGIHDISRTELDAASNLPRFNMPLELGLFLGAKRYGTGQQRTKQCLILDREQYRYQKYCSDIAGQDIRAHKGEPFEAVKLVRNWLTNATAASNAKIVLPGGAAMAGRYKQFQDEIGEMCNQVRLERDELQFNDFITLTVGWLKVNPW